MERQALKSNVFLIIAAMIWGFAFVAQRVGGEYLQPFTFNGIRFAMASVSMIPIILVMGRRLPQKEQAPRNRWKKAIPRGIIVGTILFCAATLQQAGLYYTSVGKAGFITDLYIILVPLLGLLLGQRCRIKTWLSAMIAVIGLYLISVTEEFTISAGDLLELSGALFWSLHILAIDRFSKNTDAVLLSFIQFATCSLFSLACGLLFEDTLTLRNIGLSIIPLLYAGIMSSGVAYTFQTLGQRHAKPSHSAVIFSMESVFCCIGGAIFLGENLGLRGYIGCTIMIFAMILSGTGDFDPRSLWKKIKKQSDKKIESVSE